MQEASGSGSVSEDSSMACVDASTEVKDVSARTGEPSALEAPLEGVDVSTSAGEPSALEASTEGNGVSASTGDPSACADGEEMIIACPDRLCAPANEGEASTDGG